MNYENAIRSIAESNGINMDHLAVAVKETTIMANPGIVNEINNVVVTPLPQTDAMYRFTEACVDAFIESGDTSYMDLLVEETTNTKDIINLNKFVNHHDGYATKEVKNGTFVVYRTVGGRIQDAADRIDKERSNAKLDMENEQSKIKKLLKTIKYYGYNTPKERIATALATLTKKYNEMVRNIPDDPSERKWYQSILKVIDNAITRLTGFLNKELRVE